MLNYQRVIYFMYIYIHIHLAMNSTRGIRSLFFAEALMDCFAKGSRWQDAFQLAFHMEEQGLQLDSVLGILGILVPGCTR